MTPTKPTPKVLPLFTTDCKGDPIFEDSRLQARRWHPPHYTSSTCYLWHVERGKTGKLMLVADAEKKRVPLTEGRARELCVYQASERVKLSDYPEEWAWWRASGWGLSVEEHHFAANFVEGLPAASCTCLEANRRNSRRHIMFGHQRPADVAMLNDPEQVRRLLIALLFACLHPRKVEVLTSDDGCLPDEVEAAFVQEQRRKMKRLGIS